MTVVSCGFVFEHSHYNDRFILGKEGHTLTIEIIGIWSSENYSLGAIAVPRELYFYAMQNMLIWLSKTGLGYPNSINLPFTLPQNGGVHGGAASNLPYHGSKTAFFEGGACSTTRAPSTRGQCLGLVVHVIVLQFE